MEKGGRWKVEDGWRGSVKLLEQGKGPDENQKAEDPDQTPSHHQIGAMPGSSFRQEIWPRLQRIFFGNPLFRPRALWRSKLTQPDRVKPLRAEWRFAVWTRPG